MKHYWNKKGLIFCPSGEYESMFSHAAVPIAEHISGDIFKIYFSSRNKNNESFTNYIIIDITNPTKILDISINPILIPGDLGEFDDSGAMATWLAHYNERSFLYYIGWNLGVTVPFRNSLGLAVRDDKKEFTKYAKGPVLDRSMDEPHFVASCCVIPCKEKWRMWYLSCVGWKVSDNGPEHRYHIKYAESEDGILWDRKGIVAIDFKDDDEYAISRPSVIYDKYCWKMWYSYRGQSYRIGYAESDDGIHWKRLDKECGIDVSESGWDSEMIEYPFVFDHAGVRYMLYNGNEFGKSGFGLAVMEEC